MADAKPKAHFPARMHKSVLMNMAKKVSESVL